MKAREDGVDRGENGAAVASGNQDIGDWSNDANVWLRSDTLKNLIQRHAAHVVNDLSILHASAWGNVQGRHIPANVAVTDNCENLAYGHNELQSPEPNDLMKN